MCIRDSIKDIESAENWFEKGFNMLDHENILETKKVLEEYDLIASSFLYDIKNVEKALIWYEKSLELALKLKDPLEEGTDIYEYYDNVAYVHDEMGNTQPALELYLKAMEIRKGLFEEEEVGYAEGLGNLGTTYLKLGQVDDALDVLERCYKVHLSSDEENLGLYMKESAEELLKCYELKGGEAVHGARMEELRKDLEKWTQMAAEQKGKENKEDDGWEDVDD
eukprot:TRINITY_DN6244_c0_g8_i1.p1 TRINITY_DN6244_c0_g8~~TRINITY_DN6244_c0_g8_i1.p1  ORF type:complete len:223 (+),score=51.22 TRINITY_DN6244_c0_g8_i1:65-733(+)